MNTTMAWDLFIAGFCSTGFARKVATRFTLGACDGVRFGRGEVFGTPFEEFFVRDSDPEAVVAAITAHQPLARHFITVLGDSPDARVVYERHGYLLDDTETLMVCDLSEMTIQPSDPQVHLVRGSDDAEWYNTHDPQRIRWILPENLHDPRMAHYAVLRDEQIVVRGRNFWIDEQHSYVSRIYTAEAYRGQGLARMLMGRLLADDLMRGARWSVLTASHMGLPLYQRLGYRSLAPIMIFEWPTS